MSDDFFCGRCRNTCMNDYDQCIYDCECHEAEETAEPIEGYELGFAVLEGLAVILVVWHYWQ